MPTNGDETSSGLGKKIAVASAVVVLLGSIFTLYKNWDEWFGEKTKCTISGHTFDGSTNEPLSNVAVGYATNYPGYYVQGLIPQFVRLATSGSDGAFSGDCKGIHDAASADSFEVLAFGGNCPGLPNITYTYTGQRFANRGSHDSINIVRRC
jgi:hypothetical protein